MDTASLKLLNDLSHFSQCKMQMKRYQKEDLQKLILILEDNWQKISPGEEAILFLKIHPKARINVGDEIKLEIISYKNLALMRSIHTVLKNLTVKVKVMNMNPNQTVHLYRNQFMLKIAKVM